MATDPSEPRLTPAPSRSTLLLDVEDLAQRRLRARDRQAELRRVIERDAPTSAVGVAHDSLAELRATVEELEVAEEELRQQNDDLLAARGSADAARDRYEELFELAPDGYLVTTPEGAIREANRAALSMLGTTRSYAVGKPLPLFVDEESRREVRVLMVRLQRAERVDDVELRLRPRDGEPFPVALTASAIHDHAGRTVGLRWALRDARERTAARERLTTLAAELEARVAERTRQLEARSRLHEELLRREREARDQAERAQERLRFVAAAGAALAEATGVRGVLASAARVAVPVLGDWCVTVAPAGLAGDEPVVEIAHDEPADSSLADTLRRRFAGPDGLPRAMVRALVAGKPEVIADLGQRGDAPTAADAAHLRLLHAVGMRSMLTLPLIARGRPVGVMCCISARADRPYGADELRAAEDLARCAGIALENAHAMEESDARRARAEAEVRSVARGLGMMMHDVRTPLSAISGYADLIALGAYGAVNQAQADALVRLRGSHDFLLELVENVQTFAQLENDALELEARDMDVHGLLAELDLHVEPARMAKGIAYEYRAGAPGVRVRADPTAARRILVNLLSNAVKFTAAGGRIVVSWDASPAAVRVHVADTGQGIPAEKLEAVFDPFVQLSRAGAVRGGGTGLGLAISRRLARALGGDLSVRSAVGEGSTFTLRLPRAAGEAPTVAAVPDEDDAAPDAESAGSGA